MTPDQLGRLPGVLFEIGKLIGQDLDPGPLLSRISEMICRLLDADACSVMLLDAAEERLLARAAYGLGTERVHRLSFAVGEGVAGWVIARGEPALIDDVSGDPRFVVLSDGDERAITSMACVPVVARGDRVGVVSVTSSRPAAFGSHHLELLTFLARTIALDLENIRLHRVSVTDVLTGTYNREFLLQRLPAEIDQALARGAPLALAMVDVDHFKDVNDQHGHDIGDEVLAEVARRLRAAIRGGDVLVRYGGEEFLVLLPSADAGRAWEIGERMRQRMVTRPIQIGDRTLAIHISVGVAQHRGNDGESPGELIRRADAALYTAKARGRNRVEVAP